MPRRRKSPVEVATTEAHLCSLDLRLRLLRAAPFFRSVPDEALEEINLLFHEKGFAPGEFLYLAGDPAARVYVLAEGRARLLRETAGGRQVMLDLLVPGEFFGALGQDGGAYPDTVQALTPICALSTPVEAFRDVLRKHPAAALDVLDVVSRRLLEAHDTIHLLSAEPAEKRIAHVLLRLGEKLGRSDEVGLLIQTPLGRDELAEMAGVTPETASRVISQFQKEGWIETGRQWVALRDRGALRRVLE